MCGNHLRSCAQTTWTESYTRNFGKPSTCTISDAILRPNVTRLEEAESSRKLLDRGGGFQIDALPLAGDDSLANLVRSLLLLGHQVTVIDLFHAGAAMHAVLAFKAAVQALVGLFAAITVAIAGLLIDDLGYLGGKFVRMLL